MKKGSWRNCSCPDCSHLPPKAKWRSSKGFSDATTWTSGVVRSFHSSYFRERQTSFKCWQANAPQTRPKSNEQYSIGGVSLMLLRRADSAACDLSWSIYPSYWTRRVVRGRICFWWTGCTNWRPRREVFWRKNFCDVKTLQRKHVQLLLYSLPFFYSGRQIRIALWGLALTCTMGRVRPIE